VRGQRIPDVPRVTLVVEQRVGDYGPTPDILGL
jgi:hypothetical protein